MKNSEEDFFRIFLQNNNCKTDEWINLEYSFNLNQVSAKNDKMKLQFFKMWSKKHIKTYTLYINSSNNNDKSDHNIHIIINEDYESDSDKSCKHSKN